MLSSFYQYINDNYGSKRGFLNSLKYASLHYLGRFSHITNIDFSKVQRIVFICSGNICRSPLGEYVARSHGLEAESFGLNCRGGDPADPRAIDFAASLGIDMKGHATRNIKEYKPMKGDLLVGMEPKHIDAIEPYINGGAQKTIATLWYREKSPYLHDPYNTNTKFFANCESRVAKAAKVIAENAKI